MHTCIFLFLWTSSKTNLSFCFLINVLPRLTFHQAAEGYRDWRAGVPTLGDNAAGVEEAVVTLVGPLSMAVVVTRSHRGHIDRVDAGSGSQLWGEITVGGPTFIALSSSTSLCSLLFCSVNEPNHLFKYSHSISVCFSLLLLIKLNHINNYDRSSTELYSISKEHFNWCFSSCSQKGSSFSEHSCNKCIFSNIKCSQCLVEC